MKGDQWQSVGFSGSLSIAAILSGACLAIVNPSKACAHDLELTKVAVTVDAPRACTFHLHYDVDAWVVGARPEHLTPDDLRRLSSMPPAEVAKRLEELRDHILRNVRIRFDEQKVGPRIEIIENPERIGTPASHVSALSRIVRLTVDIPPGSRAFDFWASRSFGNIVLLFRRAGQSEIVQQLVEKGARSLPYELTPTASQTTRWQVARQYLLLGFEHIVPKGTDHILFVLGLFLLSTKLGSLLWQVTAFTLAHTLSLALSMYGVISLSPRIVEPLIALSIAAVAIENVCTSRLHSWRPVVVFAFGLLHGLGFAGVLMGLGLPRTWFATALVSFNCGVEIGQLSVIALALLAVGWFRGRTWYRRRIVIPCSVAIALVGLYWTVERALG